MECISFYESSTMHIGDIASLSFTDFLIYRHCHIALSKEFLFDFSKLPPPPSKVEAVSLYNYECSIEQNLDINAALLSQPKIIAKALLASFHGIKEGCDICIESGTFLGASSYLFSGVFDKVHTIEADPLLYKSSSSFLSVSRDNITAYHGNSASIIPKILESLSNHKVLFFLDAHYSTGITSRDFGICPLIAELNAIFQSTIDFTIVIDDARCMNGSDGYPSFSDIFALIPSQYCVYIQYDQIVISKHCLNS